MEISVRCISRIYFWRGMITRLWELSPKVDRLSKLKTASILEKERLGALRWRAQALRLDCCSLPRSSPAAVFCPRSSPPCCCCRRPGQSSPRWTARRPRSRREPPGWSRPWWRWRSSLSWGCSSCSTSSSSPWTGCLARSPCCWNPANVSLPGRWRR